MNFMIPDKRYSNTLQQYMQAGVIKIKQDKKYSLSNVTRYMGFGIFENKREENCLRRV